MIGVRGELGRGCLALLVLLASSAHALEVRVRSQDAAGGTRVVIDVGESTVRVVDRTPHTIVPAPGTLAAGATFADEITLELPTLVLRRPVSIDVSDELVSAVRARASDGGTRVVLLVRRPVTYEVRPTADARGFVVQLAASGLPRPEGEGAAAASGSGKESVAVDADSVSYDRATDTVSARGDVTIVRGDTTLRADEVQYARTTQIAHATGHVSLIDPEMTVHGSAAELNLDEEVGWVEDADADLPDSRYHVEARRLEKCGPVSYIARDGVFTTSGRS